MAREARVVRGVVPQIREFDSAEAACALGTNDRRIVPLIVQRISVFAYAISTEVSRSSLGVDAPAELPSWGHMLSEGRAYEGCAPCIAMVPGLVLVAMVLEPTFMADGLRDELDPRLRGI